jgi:hypothetical protein
MLAKIFMLEIQYLRLGTYQVETNPSVQTMETSIGVTRC